MTDEQVRKIRWAAGLFVIFNDRMDQIEVVSRVSDFKPHSQEFKQMIVVLVRDNAVASGSTIDETVDGVCIGSRKENEKFCLYLDEEPQTKRNVFTVKNAYECNYIDKFDLETISALTDN